MADDERDEIRSRTDIVDLVGQRVALKRTGKHYTGLCPFHDDKHPSFTVDPQTGRYRCWSCNESGDAFTWVMKTENVDFVEALKVLAQRAGIQLKGRSGGIPPQEREMFQQAMHEALKYFREQLVASSFARDYCAGRGIDQAAIDTWEIGFAPDNGEGLATRLKRAGLPLPLCKDLFLVDEDRSGGYFDKFRRRLMFPIYDERSQLVAFGGRLLGDGQPKYINSSDTPLYRKSRVLYGLQVARDTLMKTRRAVLVEGYLDVIACHRSGVTGAVASLGTSLGEDHAKLLKKWSDGVTIFYDGDSAGQKATERAIPILEAEGLRVRVALLPEGDDPDTLLKRSGPSAVDGATKGVSPTAFRLAQLETRLKPEQEEFWIEAISILGQAKEDLEREGHLLRLAGLYPHVRDVRTALARLTKMVEDAHGPDKRDRPRRNPQGATPQPFRLQEKLQAAETIVFGALHEPSFQKLAWIAMQTPEIFSTGSAVALAKAIAAAFPAAPPNGAASHWIHLVEPEEMRRLLSDINLDFHNATLSEDVVIDSISSLRKQAINRDLRRVRLQDLTPEERQEIWNRIRVRNADEEEGDPFS